MSTSPSTRRALRNRNKHKTLDAQRTEEGTTAHGDNRNAASPIIVDDSLVIQLNDDSPSSFMFSTDSRGPKITDETEGGHDYFAGPNTSNSINLKRRSRKNCHQTIMAKSSLTRGASCNSALIADAIPRIEFGPRETASFKTLLRPEPVSYRRLAMLVVSSEADDCEKDKRTNISLPKQKVLSQQLPRATSRFEHFYPSSYDAIDLQLSILEPITSTLWGILIGATIFFPRFMIRIIMRKEESHDSSPTTLSSGSSGIVEHTKSTTVDEKIIASETWGYFTDFREEKQDAMFLPAKTSLRWPQPRARGVFTLEKVTEYEYEFEE